MSEEHCLTPESLEQGKEELQRDTAFAQKKSNFIRAFHLRRRKSNQRKWRIFIFSKGPVFLGKQIVCSSFFFVLLLRFGLSERKGILGGHPMRPFPRKIKSLFLLSSFFPCESRFPNKTGGGGGRKWVDRKREKFKEQAE